MSAQVAPGKVRRSQWSGSQDPKQASTGSQTSSQQYYGNRPLIEYANPPTGNPDLAFKLMDAAHKRVDNYFGLMTENVLPAKWQAKLQRMTDLTTLMVRDCLDAFVNLDTRQAERVLRMDDEVDRYNAEIIQVTATPQATSGAVSGSLSLVM